MEKIERGAGDGREESLTATVNAKAKEPRDVCLMYEPFLNCGPCNQQVIKWEKRTPKKMHGFFGRKPITSFLLVGHYQHRESKRGWGS